MLDFFFLFQPCMGVRTALGDTIDSLVNCEVLRVPVVSEIHSYMTYCVFPLYMGKPGDPLPFIFLLM